MNNFGILPDELITQIVQNVDSRDLYACSLINKQFHAVVNPMLWRSINVKNKVVFTQFMTGLVESSPPMGEHVRHVHLDASTTDTQLLDFMKHVPYLEDLIMKNAQYITDTSFQHLPTCCPRLNILELQQRGALTQQSVLVLAQCCSQLSELVLTSDQGVPYTALLALTACPLEDLTITLHYHMNKLDDEWNDIAAIFAGFTHLQRLNIDHSPPHLTRHLITSLTLHPDWMPHLTEFMIDGCGTLTEQQTIDFMKTHSAIIALGLLGNTHTDTFLQAIPLSLDDTTFLDLSFCREFTAAALRRLILDCPSLEWMVLSGCNIRVDDFPEADADSLDDDGGLDHLDDDTIRAIRLEQHDRGAMSEMDEDDDAWEEQDDSEYERELEEEWQERQIYRRLDDDAIRAIRLEQHDRHAMSEMDEDDDDGAWEEQGDSEYERELEEEWQERQIYRRLDDDDDDDYDDGI